MNLAYKLGADPEMFVQNSKGVFESAFGMIKGNKERPTPVKNGAVQVDGMALEFNIDPAENEQQFLHNISSVVEQMKAMVPHYRVVAAPVAHFGYEYIKAQPEEARELGCNPDYNAYTEQENPRPDADLPFRTGAGHVHIGWTSNRIPLENNHYQACIKVVKQMDVFLGIPSLLFDDNTERRAMYGQAGAFRPKAYGVEYRTLSNVWVSEERFQKWVYRATMAGMKALEDGRYLWDEIGQEEINAIINTSNVEKAKEIVAKFNLILPEA